MQPKILDQFSLKLKLFEKGQGGPVLHLESGREMGVNLNKVVAKFCAILTPFRDHQFGENQPTRGLSFLQSARRGRECDKLGPCKE